VATPPGAVCRRAAFLMGLRKMYSAQVPELAWHLGEPRIDGARVSRGGVHFRGFHPEIPGLLFAPFLLNI